MTFQSTSVHWIVQPECKAVATGQFVAYYRVSTAKQGHSGLGLDAQRKAVMDHLNGGSWDLVAEYTEVESGKRNDRPELDKALATCRLHRATLVIAKIDRLSRNAAFLLNLRDAGVDFVAADMPDANRMTVGIMAVIAEHEREAIAKRTRDALAAAKARNKKLGNPQNLSAAAAVKGRQLGNAAKTAQVTKRLTDLAPVIHSIQSQGKVSLNQIAAALNERRVPASRGGSWSAVQVSRVLERMQMITA
jgi:DNA invertase Pin-like site-specific DNA recombinase